jgi:RTX calcium-binding nonapeptide repeat (4 copies)
MRRRASLASFGIAVGLLALAPAGASAVTVGLQAGPTPSESLLVLDDPTGATNTVALTTVTVVVGHPDIVIGDAGAGIPDPFPGECARVDPTIIRCPATAIGVLGNLGAGNDSLSVAAEFTYPRMFGAAEWPARPAAAAEVPTVRMQFGPGGDAGSDLSPAQDQWNGGPGRDRFNSGPSNDTVSGGAQNDVIDCGAGKHDVGISGPGRLDLGRHCEVVRH